MPRGNRTGPAGMGPMTGRAAGYCVGYGPAYYGGWSAPAAYGAPAYGALAYGAYPPAGFFRGRRFGFGPGFGSGPAWGRGRRGRW